MYILIKLEKRAHTTDTLIYYISATRSSLEEIILSLYDELCDSQIDKRRIKEYLDSFYIIDAPFLED